MHLFYLRFKSSALHCSHFAARNQTLLHHPRLSLPPHRALRSGFRLLLWLVCLIGIGACANRDRWLNRQWHSLNGHYNAYFNAREQLHASVAKLADAHEDDYRSILRVFPYGDVEAGKSEGDNLDVVIKKSTKVIQKHRVGNWVDDSYLLIGKAYMLKREHFLAIETFQYINSNYEDSKEVSAEALIWLARNYILMEQYGDAKAVLTLIRTKEKLIPKVQAPFHLTQAELAIQQNDYSLAIESLREAIPDVKDRDRKLRYQFIEGQLMMRSNRNTSASRLFREVIKKNPPYEMAFQAKLNLVRAYDGGQPETYRQLKKFLLKMLDDEKNDDNQDKIYYELALLELKEDNRKAALDYFEQSLRSGASNETQKALTFLKLGELNLEQARYKPAKVYYDSAALFMNPELENYEKAMAKKEVLGQLINNLVTIEREDSLLALSRLDRATLNARIDTLIARKQRQAAAEAAAREAAAAEESAGAGTIPLEQRLQQRQNNQASYGSGSDWYFYNVSAKGSGYNQFVRQWGKRPLQDNWRFEETQVRQQGDFSDGDTTDSDTLAAPTDSIAEEPLDPALKALLDTVSEDKAPYYRDIPFTETQQQAARNAMAAAYADMGYIYAEDIGNFSEAISAYQTITQRFRDSKYYVRSLYYLHKLHLYQKDSALAQAYMDTLLQRYPDDDYTLLLIDPERLRQRARLSEYNPKLEKLYQAAFTAYQSGRCDTLGRLEAQADEQFEINYYDGRLAYLRLLCPHRGDTAFDTLLVQLKQLEERLEDDPVQEHLQNTIRYLETRQGGARVQKQKKPIYDSDFVPEPQFYLMTFNIRKGNQNRVVSAFSNLNMRKGLNKQLTLSTQMLNEDTAAIVIRGFAGVEAGVNYYRMVENSKKFQEQAQLPAYAHFVISRTNFITLRKKQALAAYVDFFQRYYLEQRGASSLNE